MSIKSHTKIKMKIETQKKLVELDGFGPIRISLSVNTGITQ